MGWGRSFNNFRPGFCYPHDNRTGLGLIKGGTLEPKPQIK